MIYQVHVKAFFDSNGNGIGDFPGLTEKLDYIRDLGVTALWLLPFYPSPLKDDGYDIADYVGVHPSYGTLRDFKEFLDEAHKRGLHVITEMVLNHTSDQHPWFQRARRSPPGGRWRDFYVWSDTPERYKDARVIFKDFETSNWTWDPVAKAYYWHRFYSHQPDLNYENPLVQRAVLRAVDFWLNLGVDGLRLDAVPYLYEREGTNCENLPETHAFLKTLRRRVDEKFPNRMLLGEANQWPEDAMAYFGDGDECHMAFHFPLMPRMFMANRMEDRFPIVDIMQQTPPIPASSQWALFLRNHDELTLEMVTDEERDYMYRVYAQDPQMRVNLGIRRRLAPLLGNDRRKIELMNGLLFALPGTPILYYGDEIGMGDNVYLGDRNAVRTPMQWSADRNAGFSRTNPQRLYLPVILDPEHHYEAVNVEAQQKNPSSLLWWMKRLIAVRKRHRAFGSGSLEFLHPENRKVLAFIRRWDDQHVLVVANLSRTVQAVELDLSAFQGRVPVELFGRTRFPPVREQPMLLTLSPHGFYWFSLEAQPEQVRLGPSAGSELDYRLPIITIEGSWEEVFADRARESVEAALPDWLRTRRWFGGKARTIQATRILDQVPIPREDPVAAVVLVQVEYVEGEPETYVVPLTFAPGPPTVQAQDSNPALAYLSVQGRHQTEEGVLCDAMGSKVFTKLLPDTIGRRRQYHGESGEILGTPTDTFRRVFPENNGHFEPRPLRGEQSNTSVLYGDRAIIKFFRRAEPGPNPDWEIGRYLTERARFPHTPSVIGVIEYRKDEEPPVTLGILHSYVPNQGDAWRYTLDDLDRYFERALAQPAALQVPVAAGDSILAHVDAAPPGLARDMFGSYLDLASLLGRRTAELHLALASEAEDPEFAAEPFSDHYRRALYHGMTGLATQSFQLLRQRMGQLPEGVREDARRVLGLEAEVRKRFLPIRTQRITAMRIRHHGDYHLGQVLFTGKDFVIIDFEGEPARPIGERRIKRSPLRDVAGMLRSYSYAAEVALAELRAAGHTRDASTLNPWARFWQTWVRASFLKSYLSTVGESSFLPRSREELQVLLDVYLLEKACYELSYELNNRPHMVHIPLQGIAQLVGKAG